MFLVLEMARKAAKKSSSGSNSKTAVSFVSSCSSLISSLSTITSPRSSEQAAVKLLRLKRLSRSCLEDLKRKESDLTSAKHRVEREGLDLQNLLYEKQHLLMEIQLAKELQVRFIFVFSKFFLTGGWVHNANNTRDTISDPEPFRHSLPSLMLAFPVFCPFPFLEFLTFILLS